MSDLPRYDTAGTCLKCASNDIATEWHAGRQWATCVEVERLDTSFPPEHLCRRCRRCGYRWAEQTEDTP